MKAKRVERKRWKQSVLSILSVCAMAVLNTSAIAQVGTYQIGSGTATITGQSALPVTNYDYSYSQQIIKGSEINSAGGAAGTITKLRYHVKTVGTMSVWDQWTVYMGNTTKDEFSSITDFVPLSDLTEVYNGTVTAVNESWMEITLTVPFNYTGDNIVVAVHEKKAGWLSEPTFYSYTSTPNSGLVFRRDGTVIDPANLTGMTASNTYSVSAVPQIQFEGAVMSCLPPTNLQNPSGDLTSAVLTWEGITGQVGDYELRYGSVGFDIATATPIIVSGETYTVVDASGNYEFVVRHLCDGDDPSSWSTRKTFRINMPGEDCSTPIEIDSLPYITTDDTANYTDNPNIEGAPGVSGCGVTSGSNYLNGNDVVYKYTSTFDGTLKVTMSDLTASWSGIFVYNSCADIGVNCIAGAGNSGTGNRVIELPVSMGVDYYFVISTWANPQTVGYTLSMEELLCATPTGVTTQDVVYNGATATWTGATDVAYEINWGTGTFAAGDGANTDAIAVGNTSFDFVGLAGSTTYRYFVRTNCDTDGYSDWVGPYTFTTPVTPATSPWFEGFANTSTPIGWTLSGWDIETSNSRVPNYDGIFISRNLYNFDSSGTINIIPVMNIQDGDEFKFYYLLADWSLAPQQPVANSVTIDVKISTDNGATYTTVDTFTNDGVTQGWQEYVYDLSAYEGEIIKIQIVATRTNDDFELAFDSFSIMPPDVCEKVMGVVAQNITPESVEVTWTEIAGVVGYEWYVFANNANVNTDTPLFTGTTTINSATISGLDDNTDYDLYVKADCGTSMSLFYSTKLDFRTLIAPASAPWIEEFASSATPVGWTTTGWTISSTYSSIPALDGFYIYKNLWGSSLNGTFTTIDVTDILSGYELSFNYLVVDYDNPPNQPAANSLTVEVRISTDNGATFTTVDTFTNDGTTEGWQDYTFDMSAYAGETVKVRFYAVRSAGDFLIAFDNIAIGEPVCTTVAPTGDSNQTLTAGQTLADLVVVGDNLKWYSDAELENEIPATTVPTSGATYYVTQTVGCESVTALAITVDIPLSENGLDLASLRVYPNPVINELNIDYKEIISKVAIFDINGRQVGVYELGNTTNTIPVNSLSSGTYLIKIQTESNHTSIVKFVKK